MAASGCDALCCDQAVRLVVRDCWLHAARGATSTARAPMPSRYRFGSHSSPTCCLWSYRDASNAPGASREWPPCSASCSCITSTATLFLRIQKRTGQRFCKKTGHHRHPYNCHSSNRGAYFFKKTSATPVYRHCGRFFAHF